MPKRPQQPKPKTNPRLAKGRQLADLLDDATCFVNGHYFLEKPAEVRRHARHIAKQRYRSLTGFSCSGDIDCECPGCLYEAPQPKKVEDYRHCTTCHAFGHATITRVLTAWLAESSSFDEFYSRVIGTFPDSHYVHTAVLPRVEHIWKKYLVSFENQEEKS